MAKLKNREFVGRLVFENGAKLKIYACTADRHKYMPLVEVVLLKETTELVEELLKQFLFIRVRKGTTEKLRNLLGRDLAQGVFEEDE